MANEREKERRNRIIMSKKRKLKLSEKSLLALKINK